MRDKIEITYEQFIGGALLKFDSIDLTDLSFLADDFCKKYNGVITLRHSVCGNLNEYINYPSQGFPIKLKFSLDEPFGYEKISIKEKLTDFSGEYVNNYFNTLDIEEFKRRKELFIDRNRDNVLENANILLISSDEGDYEVLKLHGFKNVNYFQSIMRANQYFLDHSDELKNYHIVLRGRVVAQPDYYESNLDIDKRIQNLVESSSIFFVNYDVFDYPPQNIFQITFFIRNKKTGHSLSNVVKSYDEFFNQIIEQFAFSELQDSEKLEPKVFPRHKDYINPNRLPLPKKKSDLKILFLTTLIDVKYAEANAQKLGLNIDFMPDNNYSLYDMAVHYLGEYDIIIASALYSNSLTRMNFESTEQCKDTGRELTLLVTYNDRYLCLGYSSELGNGIKINYSFGGNATNNPFSVGMYKLGYSKEFRMLKEPVEIDDEEKNEYIRNEVLSINGIIEAAVNIYNDALCRLTKSSISDLDLRTADEFLQEYLKAYKKREEKLEAELAPIKEFDDMCAAIKILIEANRRGYINLEKEGLRIIETKDTITIETFYAGRTISTMTYKNSYNSNNLRIFDIQSLTKKGMLSPKQTVGIYPSSLGGCGDVPNRPDENQEKIISSIKKKINYLISQLNATTYEKKLNSQKNVELSLKRKKQNRRKKK